MIMPTLDNVTSRITQFVRGNPLITTSIAGITTAGITAGVVSIARRKKSKKKRTTKKRKTKRKTPKKRKKVTRKKCKHTKRKKSGSNKIRKTKNGQPYIILASGKAKFISKKSASLSRKRKGGRY